jgi:hypothetical protein
MKQFKKNYIIFSLIVLSLPVLFLFQNCGQQGGINTKNTDLAINSVNVSDSLVIKPIDNLEQFPNIVDDTQSISNGGSSADVRLNPPSDIVIDDGKNSSSRGPKGSIGTCGKINISDILLKVSSVGVANDLKSNLSFEVIDIDKYISLDKLTLKIKALKNISNLKEIFILLDSSGNKILSTENVTMSLVTPSAQESGLKIKLIEPISIQANSSYNLDLVINQNDQIIANKTKCIFKPVIQEAHLIAL